MTRRRAFTAIRHWFARRRARRLVPWSSCVWNGPALRKEKNRQRMAKTMAEIQAFNLLMQTMCAETSARIAAAPRKDWQRIHREQCRAIEEQCRIHRELRGKP